MVENCRRQHCQLTHAWRFKLKRKKQVFVFCENHRESTREKLYDTLYSQVEKYANEAETCLKLCQTASVFCLSFISGSEPVVWNITEIKQCRRWSAVTQWNKIFLCQFYFRTCGGLKTIICETTLRSLCILTLWCPLLPYVYSYKASCARRG